MNEIRGLFVESAIAVSAALADDAVADAWDTPSVLAEQTVGGLAGHIARGGVWVVGDYLDAAIPDAPFASTAARYFADAANFLSAADHRAIRARGAEVAQLGHREVCTRLRERLDALQVRLATEPPDRTVGVAAGVSVMMLDRYLETRIVEQIVHLDDLARSLGRSPWPVPRAATELVLHVGVDIARLRGGDVAALRAIYRSEPGAVFPVV